MCPGTARMQDSFACPVRLSALGTVPQWGQYEIWDAQWVTVGKEMCSRIEVVMSDVLNPLMKESS